MLAVVAAVLGFGSSTALDSAYGIAVTGTMLITTVLTFFAIRYAWRLNWALCLTWGRDSEMMTQETPARAGTTPLKPFLASLLAQGSGACGRHGHFYIAGS